jgi:hypothetical protein
VFIRLPRAAATGYRLSEKDAAVVKGMLLRGDRQSDIAAFFCVNGGRIAEINKGMKHSDVLPQTQYLPPPGPYRSTRMMRLLDEACEARGEDFVVLLLKSCLETKDARSSPS